MYDIAVHTGRTAREMRKCSGLEAHHESILLAAFTFNPYIDQSTLMQLVQQTGLSKQRINFWFKDKRKQLRLTRKEGTLPKCKCPH